MLHSGPDQPKTQTKVLGHSLIRSLFCLLAHFAHSLARGTMNDLMAIYSVFFSILAHSVLTPTLMLTPTLSLMPTSTPTPAPSPTPPLLSVQGHRDKTCFFFAFWVSVPVSEKKSEYSHISQPFTLEVAHQTRKQAEEAPASFFPSSRYSAQEERKDKRKKNNRKKRKK